MKSLSFFIAYRYLFKTAYEQNIGTMILVSFLGIFVGTFALTLVAAITKGFETEIHQKIQGVNAQIIIRSSKESIDYKGLSAILHDEFPEITYASPSCTKHGIIRSIDEEVEQSFVVAIHAIDPELDANVTSFYKKIVQPHTKKNKKQFSQLIKNDHVIIGSGVAEALHISVGDELEILIPEDTQKRSKKVTFLSQKALVSGIFKTGIDDADTGMIVCNFSFFEELFPETDIDQVNITLSPHASESDTIHRLHNRTNLHVYSWRDLYPALVSALALEKYVSFAVLLLVALVASMSMISLIFMLITQKRTDIAILKAYGASDSSISLIFITVGLCITTSATVCGLFGAWVISTLLQKYPFITLPDAYLVTQLPVDLTFSILITVFITVLLLGFFAIHLPVRKIKALPIADVLRFEG